jgi:heat shock protein HslJ
LYLNLIIVLFVGALLSSGCAERTTEGETVGVEKTLFVGPGLVDCVGVALQKCMLVKENMEDEYMNFYDQIEGFDYVEGYEYELIVRVDEFEGPPVDASSLMYTLVEVVKQTQFIAPEEPVEKTIFIGPVLVDCVGVAPQVCVLVKENAEDEYEFFYDQIEGFEYEEGYEFELIVRIEEVENPPADASSLRYVLLEVLRKTKVDVPDAFIGVLWKLVSYRDSFGNEAMLIPGSEITALFDEDGGLRGFAGCSTYSTSFIVEGSQLTIGLTNSTMMYCENPEGIMDQEAAYLTALQGTAKFKVEDDMLQLFDARDSVSLQYQAAELPQITDRTWRLVYYGKGNGVFQPILQDSLISSEFDDANNLSGSAGCNQYTTSYLITGENISTTHVGSTRKMCSDPEGIMEQELSFNEILEMAETYQLEGGRLEMYNSEGSLLLVYVDDEFAATTPEMDEALAKATYQSIYIDAGKVTLENGEYREKISDDSAIELVVMMTDFTTYGTLTTGEEGAGVILVSDPGGSGSFYDLSAVIDHNGELVNVANTLLADRARIDYLALEEGIFTIMMAKAGPQDPLCCPTQIVVEKYELQGEKLVQMSSELLGKLAVENDLTGVVWNWTKFLASNDTETTPDNPTDYTLEFFPDGTLTVQADCNMGNGVYTLDKSSLDIQLEDMSLALCSPGTLMDEFVRLLNDVVSYIFIDEELALNVIYDTGTLMFVPGE